MPRIELRLFREEGGRVPLLEWLDELPKKARDDCTRKMERLREFGFDVRRPLADYLRDGIYELRATHRRIHYRMLYFFHGRIAVIISHGLRKEKRVPPREIERAIERKRAFERDPETHSFYPES